ncbi:MAG: DUF3999 domain-containing protein [Deferribacteraceae bacterium]|jgi:hypothetical protein|nr:DUF3999 domain-containing protein [Deferribacteraceae bacterium]
MKFIGIIIFIVIFVAGALAQEFTPEHFDYGLNVDVTEQSAVHSVILPAHVYQSTRRPELADMQVFNSAGETVPFTILNVEPYSYEPVPPKPLLFFPLYKDVLIDNVTKTVIDELIIDLRNDPLLPVSLMLDFAPTSNFNTTVSMAVSEGDLNRWAQQTSGTLARLTNASGSLILQNELELPMLPINTQYVKLSGAADVLASIIRINANYPPTPIYHASSMSLAVTGTLAENKNNIVEFDLAGFYPVESMVVELQPSYLFPSYAVKYKYKPEGGWAPANSGTTRNLNTQQTTNIDVSGYGRYWQLSTQSALPDAVTAQFHWRSQELIFLDKGESPYTIAYGSAHYERPRSGSAQIEALIDGKDINEAVSEPFKLGNGELSPDAVLVAEKSMLPTYLLAVIIVLVVIFMTFSAIRLIKSMERD